MSTNNESNLPSEVLQRFRVASSNKEAAEGHLLRAVDQYMDSHMPTSADRFSAAVEIFWRATRLMDACHEWSLADGHVPETLDACRAEAYKRIEQPVQIHPYIGINGSGHSW